MSAADKGAVVRRSAEEVMNGENVAVGEELVSPEHTNNDPPAPEVPPGRESIGQLSGVYRAASPDIHLHTGEMFAGEDRAAPRCQMMGVEPTGGRVEVSGGGNFHVWADRIVASYKASDAAGLLRQLGAPGGWAPGCDG